MDLDQSSRIGHGRICSTTPGDPCPAFGSCAAGLGPPLAEPGGTMSGAVVSTITTVVISNSVTSIGEQHSGVQGAGLCLRVLDFPHAGARQTAACAVADAFSPSRTTAPGPRPEADLRVVPAFRERCVSLPASGQQPGISLNRSQFLRELLRDGGFFAHLVFRQVRADIPSHRFVNANSRCKRSKIKPLPLLPRPRLNALSSRLPETPSSLPQTLWAEIGRRHIEILVSAKEHHDYGEDPKFAL